MANMQVSRSGEEGADLGVKLKGPGIELALGTRVGVAGAALCGEGIWGEEFSLGCAVWKDLAGRWGYLTFWGKLKLEILTGWSSANRWVYKYRKGLRARVSPQ